MDKNLEQLKREYLDWCKRFDEIEENKMNVIDKEPEYKEEWDILEIIGYDKNHEPIFNQNKDISDKEFNRLVKEYKEYSRLCDRLTAIEYAIEESKDSLEEEYKEWKDENDIWEEAKEWGKEINNGYVRCQDAIDRDYKDWASNKDVYDAMVESVNELDKDKVDLFIERLKISNDDYTQYFYDEMIEYLEVVNNVLRGKDEGSMYLYIAVDILENNGFWKPYRETFEDCLNNIAEDMKVDFRFEK